MGKAGANLKKTSINLPLWMVEALEDLSKRKSTTVTDIILKYIEQGLGKNGYFSGIGDDTEAVFSKEDIDKIGVGEPLDLNEKVG